MRLCRGLADEQPDLAHRMADAIRSAVPFYGQGGRVAAAAVDESAKEHITALVDRAAFPDGPETAPWALGERRARDGVDLADVLDAVRAGTSFLWSRMVDYARRSGTASDAELVELASEVWLMHETYIRTTTAGYRQEHSRVLLARQQERLGLVYGLLTARGREAASPWDAVDRLGLSRTEGFVVVAATSPHPRRMALPRVEQALSGAGTASAWVMVADVTLGIANTGQPSWREILRGEARTWSATVGISPIMTDFARTSLTVRLARTALATADPGQLVAFDEAPVAMAAAGSPDVTDRIVDGILGPLKTLPPVDREVLLETLSAWFASDGSIGSVAERLHVHQNTVRNRIRRLSTLTGRDLTRPRHSAELFLALSARPGISRSDGSIS